MFTAHSQVISYLHTFSRLLELKHNKKEATTKMTQTTEKKKKSNKSKTIPIRISPEEYQQLKTKADETSTSISELMRNAALKRQLPPSQLDREAYRVLAEIKTELSRIGTNINQIAKACNTSLQLGEPVVVNRVVLESNQQLLKQTIARLKDTQKSIIQ